VHREESTNANANANPCFCLCMVVTCTLQISHGEQFVSETDTEVIPKLLKYVYDSMDEKLPFPKVSGFATYSHAGNVFPLQLDMAGTQFAIDSAAVIIIPATVAAVGLQLCLQHLLWLLTWMND
jgi:hypothetical protein